MRRTLIVAAALAPVIVAASVLGPPPAGARPRPDVRRVQRDAAREGVSRQRGPLPAPASCTGCWQPGLATSWQWQLQGDVDASLGVEMYDIDGFEATRSLVDEIHAAGAAAVCYVSAGSWENFRPDDGRFPERVLGRSNGWPGERWLDVRRLRVLRPIMADRMDMCADKGFDGIEFDNVDGYRNRTGFPITGSDQLLYNVFLANQAHARGLSAALKNDLGQVRELLPYFDYALNEQCHQYHECGRLDPFVAAGKAIFGVEYKLKIDEFCPAANAHDFNFLKKELALRAWPRVPCRGV